MERKLSLRPDRKGLLLLFLISTFLFSSCEKSDFEEIDHENISVEVKIDRLDQKLFQCKSQSDIDDLIDQNIDEFNLYLELDKLPNKSILSEMLWNRIQDSSVQVFYNQSQNIYGNFSEQKKKLEHLYQHVKYYYPDFKEPKVSTFFTAFLTPVDIVVSKKHIVLGLDYFIGPDAMYVQNDPMYILERYVPENLVPMFIGLGISNFYNETNHDDQTLVADMIYYGKAHYFIKRMVHKLSESQNMGYEEGDLEYLIDNEKGLWSYFVEHELLFETNRIETSKYVSERPKTVEIAPECPGRVGRWIGYQIVKAYMEKNDVSLQELMAQKDAQKIFNSSGYNPSRN